MSNPIDQTSDDVITGAGLVDGVLTLRRANGSSLEVTIPGPTPQPPTLEVVSGSGDGTIFATTSTLTRDRFVREGNLWRCNGQLGWTRRINAYSSVGPFGFFVPEFPEAELTIQARLIAEAGNDFAWLDFTEAGALETSPWASETNMVLVGSAIQNQGADRSVNISLAYIVSFEDEA